ncbi:YcxB family protein [uncultured Oscillibacter sp.]|uniref:YcxB family protein n=1 Tax=uncultured Oscillibacter sp. TaxID=876091 RepID=UPI0025FBEE85|nr:YcxB family protein [uncultured Oscillibacter sp.]
MEYQVEMRHTEKSFEALAHMQYDLFCMGNRVARSMLSLGLVVLGVVNFSQWWGVLITAYGCYLVTSTYSAANHTAHKLSKQLRESGQDFPASRYVFKKKAMEIISLPEEKPLGKPLAYADIFRLGEDREYFYVFRDRYGGYMLPKAALGEREEAFRNFLEEKTDQTFQGRSAPVVRLLRRMKRMRRRKKT